MSTNCKVSLSAKHLYLFEYALTVHACLAGHHARQFIMLIEWVNVAQPTAGLYVMTFQGLNLPSKAIYSSFLGDQIMELVMLPDLIVNSTDLATLKLTMVKYHCLVEISKATGLIRLTGPALAKF